MFRSYDEIEPIITIITQELFAANRNGQLDGKLEQMGYARLLEQSPMPKVCNKILVLGNSRVAKTDLVSILDNLGIEEERFEFCLEYDKIKVYDFEKLRNTSKYKLIVVGPMPHSTKGKSKYNSIISRMENDESFPKVKKLTVGNSLKITKDNFEKLIIDELV